MILQYQASDILSGIQETYVNFNGVRYENGTEVIIDKAGKNIIEMVALDVAGNIRTEIAEIEVTARASVDIDPDVINLKNIDKGNAMITAYITLPSGLSVSDILLETISINGVAPVTDPKYGYVKNPVVDHEGQVVFMAKFERAALGAILSEGDNPVILTGRTGSYTFTWSGVIHAMNPGNDKKDKPENGKAKGKNKGQDIEEENEQQIDEEQEEDQEEQIDEEQNKQESQEDQIEEHDDTADSVSDIEPEEPGTQTEEDVNLEDIKE